MNSVLKGVLSRGVADLLQLAMGIAGSFLMARGEKYDASRLIELKPGAHSLMPATMAHFGLHKAGNVVEVYGEGPFAPNFVNPEDDPNRAKK